MLPITWQRIGQLKCKAGMREEDELDASNIVDVDEIEHAGLVSEAGTVEEV